MTTAALVPVGAGRPRPTDGPASVALIWVEPAPMTPMTPFTPRAAFSSSGATAKPVSRNSGNALPAAPGCAGPSSEIDSWMRSTRRSDDWLPPSPSPAKPAPGASCGFASFKPLMTRSSSVAGASTWPMRAAAKAPVSASSGLSCTMPSCEVRITSPLLTMSPSLSTCILPSAPRMLAVPQRAVTRPWNVWTMVGMGRPRLGQLRECTSLPKAPCAMLSIRGGFREQNHRMPAFASHSARVQTQAGDLLNGLSARLLET